MKEEKKRFFSKENLRNFFKKRWTMPTIYITTAAILLTAVIWYQFGNNNAVEQSPIDNNASNISGKEINDGNLALEVNRPLENFVMPVIDQDSAVIKQHFYDSSADKEEQEAALVFYNNQFHPNTGINIGSADDKSFEVVASLSGDVTKVEEDPLLGNIIEITHSEGIVTQYQAVDKIQVEVGDTVEQGHVIAQAGKSQFNKEAGVHVHFEIRKNGIPQDPLQYFNKPLSALMDEAASDEEVDQSDVSESNEGEQNDETSGHLEQQYNTVEETDETN